MLDQLRQRFNDVAPKADFCSLRFVQERRQSIMVRQNIVQPLSTGEDVGAMITVYDGGGMGYGATCDLSAEGLKRAAEQALEWARRTAGMTVVDFRIVDLTVQDGAYESTVEEAWETLSVKDKIDMLMKINEQLKIDDKIVDWHAALTHRDVDTCLMQAGGGMVRQHYHFMVPSMAAIANEGAETVRRTFGGFRLARQGGLEVLKGTGYLDAAPRTAAEALEVLAAPDCPSGKMDLLLAPDQMILQIHESIGHPLELDRILGDERNYAGTSFVTPNMFGSYRYGSNLLNITYDPNVPGELATFAFDDDGRKAQKEYIIKEGILQRPLGGTISQARSGLPGVANARACNWNRPPIDRMANLNLEPGTSTFDDMVKAVERGVFMESNCSWSIDDSRNKFQFGCERAQIIEDGELKQVVKKPNYRGISATFWRNLKMVADKDSNRVLGTPNCGKGEPNQMINVGHASPAALFADVDVFGGAS